MNFQPMQVQSYHSASQMLADAQERRRRLWGSQKPKPAPALPQMTVKPVVKPVVAVQSGAVDEATFRAREYDAHVQTRKIWKARCFTSTGRYLMDYCAAKGWPISWIEERSRRKEVVHARQEMMFMLRNKIGLSYPRIGRLMGGLDHTSAIYGERQHRARMETPGPKKLIPAPGEDLKHCDVKGVTWSRRGRKWEVRIKAGGKVVYLGRYVDLAQAIQVCENYRREVAEGKNDGQGT